MRTISLLFLLCSLCSPLLAEQYFVLFDANCMQRLEYEQAISQQPRMAYYAYQIPLAGGEFLTLETGVEGAVAQDYLPTGYLTCGSPVLNRQLTDRINGNSDRVFMLVPDGQGNYLVQPVAMANLRTKNGNSLSFESPLAHFNFDIEDGIIGENLAIDNPGARVYFEGRDNAACTHVYLFRQLMPRNAYPVIDYKLSAELGVVERRLGSDGNSTLGGVVVLRKINGLPLNSYLADWCAQAQPTLAGNTVNQPQVYYGTPSIPVTNSPVTNTFPPAPNTTTPAAAQPTNTVSATMHTVNRGETLYGLSRQYNTSVDQLKSWNNLSSNEILVGQQLMVSQPVVVATTPQTNNLAALSPGSGPVLPINRGQIGSSNPGAAQPVPYGQSPALAGSSNTTQEYYVVQPGETVASVALRLGYTEARFREINELGPREVIRVGQRLKVNDCDCPETVASQSPINQPANNPIRQPGVPVNPSNNRAAAPTTFSQTPTLPGQRPSNPTNPAQAPARPFNSNPNFGAVIPEAYQPPRSSMAELERGSSPAAPATYSGSNPYGNTNYTTPQTYNNPNEGRAIHVVQEGESLYSISNRYGITVDQLRTLNNMTATDIIIPFQRLFVN